MCMVLRFGAVHASWRSRSLPRSNDGDPIQKLVFVLNSILLSYQIATGNVLHPAKLARCNSMGEKQNQNL